MDMIGKVKVNAQGVFLCCQAVLPTMVAKRYGKIINVGSIAGLRMSFFGSLVYTASKHALTGITQHLAWEAAEHGINVNAICPGGILTKGIEEVSTPEMREKVIKRSIPLGRMCLPQDIGELVSFLASDRAQMITGQIIAIDGGTLTGYGEDIRALLHQRRQATPDPARHPHTPTRNEELRIALRNLTDKIVVITGAASGDAANLRGQMQVGRQRP
jgi:hypothetical protein